MADQARRDTLVALLRWARGAGLRPTAAGVEDRETGPRYWLVTPLVAEIGPRAVLTRMDAAATAPVDLWDIDIDSPDGIAWRPLDMLVEIGALA